MRTLGSFNRQVNLPNHPDDYMPVADERPAVKTLQTDGYTLGIARNTPPQGKYGPTGGDFGQSRETPGRRTSVGNSFYSRLWIGYNGCSFYDGICRITYPQHSSIVRMGKQFGPDTRVGNILDAAPISQAMKDRMAGQYAQALTGVTQNVPAGEQNRNLNLAKSWANQPIEPRTDEDIEKQQQIQKSTGYVA